MNRRSGLKLIVTIAILGIPCGLRARGQDAGTATYEQAVTRAIDFLRAARPPTVRTAARRGRASRRL